MSKYDKVFLSHSMAYSKKVIRSHGVPLKSWRDWNIDSSSYNDRQIEVRITNQVEKVLEEVEEYYSNQRQLTASDSIRQARVFYCEAQDLLPKFFEEVKSSEKSLSDVKQKIVGTEDNTITTGDIFVIIDKYQPVLSHGGFGKKKLKITVVGYGLFGPAAL